MRNQWLNTGNLPRPVAQHDRFEHKVLLCVWPNYEGPIHFELVPSGHGITAQLYSEQLERMYEVLKRKYHALVNRKHVLLHQSNAPPYVAQTTKQKITELEAIELLPQPAYSPDFAPSDYYLFRSMVYYLQGRRFQNVDDVEVGITKFFASKSKEWCMRGI